MSLKKEPREIIHKIEKVINLEEHIFTTLEAGEDIFRKAVATILSQNTNDRNSIEAFKELDSSIEITPENMVDIGLEELAEKIRLSGLYIQKARGIKELAQKVEEELGGDLSQLSSWETEKARNWLLSIKGIGRKTADIILMHLGHPTFPVDTHIARVTCRIGLAESRNYEEVARVWLEGLDPEEYFKTHLLLIAFGREICVSRRPRCGKCPINQVCRYYLEDGEDCKT